MPSASGTLVDTCLLTTAHWPELSRDPSPTTGMPGKVGRTGLSPESVTVTVNPAPDGSLGGFPRDPGPLQTTPELRGNPLRGPSARPRAPSWGASRAVISMTTDTFTDSPANQTGGGDVPAEPTEGDMPCPTLRGGVHGFANVILTMYNFHFSV